VTEQVGTRKLEILSITAGTGFVNQAGKFGKEIAGKQYSKYIVLHKGDFSYNKGNSRLYPQGCIYRLEDRDEAAVPNVFDSFRFKEGVNSDYYKHLFLSGFLNRQLARLINSGVRNNGLLNLYDDDFYGCILPVPPASEQARIAGILSTWDRATLLKEQLIEAKKQQKQWLMHGLLTGELRLPGFVGEWKENTLSGIVHLGKEKADPSKATDETQCIELEHVEAMSGRLIGTVQANRQRSAKAVFSAGDVLFGKLRPYLCKYYRASESGLCSTEFWVLKPVSNRVVSEYLCLMVQMPSFTKLCAMSTGSKMPRADWSTIRSAIVSYPETKEQTAIAAVLSSADREIDLHRQALEQLKRQKNALMQLLLTGATGVTQSSPE
jgi:type I restriction enzyme S subunit